MRKEVEDAKIGPSMTAERLMREMGRSGVFGAGRLSRAVDTLSRMMDADVVFMGLAGAMVPGGMRCIVADMIRDGMVDVLVSTGANVTHDLMCAFGAKQFRGLGSCDDTELRKRGVSRIYDSFVDQEAFEVFEKSFASMYREITEGRERITPSELLRGLGERLDDPSSFTCSAAKRDVPIFVPAFSDSILGMQTYFQSQIIPAFLDVLSDLGRIIEISCKAESSGALLVGGGVPKNFILQSKLVAPRGFDYAVQITTDRPEPGGLSGATLDEAVSWGKLEADSLSVTVYGDATILLPLMIAAARERLGGRLPRKGRS